MNQLNKLHIVNYFSNTYKRRKMIQAIWKGRRRKEDIAYYSRTTSRAVQAFIADCLCETHGIHQFLTIKERWNPVTGRQLAYEFTFDPLFLETLDWLEKNHYLNSPTIRRSHVLTHFDDALEKMESHRKKPSKLLPQIFKTSPLLKDLIKDKEEDTIKEACVKIKPAVQIKGLDQNARVFSSRWASDYEICEAIRATKYQIKHGKINNPSAYFVGTLKRNMIKFRGLSL